ncbi:MAG: aminotransferase class I/II-fold pyridoxal phosphate-dependent enzyme [Chloroflexota bacterium]
MRARHAISWRASSRSQYRIIVTPPRRRTRRSSRRPAPSPTSADGGRVRPTPPDVRQGLNRIGLPTVEPKGAFYAFPRITGTGLTSDQFSERLLFDHQVAVVPGSAFGPSGGGFVRASLATSYEGLEEALVRIERFLGTLG